MSLGGVAVAGGGAYLLLSRKPTTAPSAPAAKSGAIKMAQGNGTMDPTAQTIVMAAGAALSAAPGIISAISDAFSD